MYLVAYQIQELGRLIYSNIKFSVFCVLLYQLSVFLFLYRLMKRDVGTFPLCSLTLTGRHAFYQSLRYTLETYTLVQYISTLAQYTHNTVPYIHYCMCACIRM